MSFLANTRLFGPLSRLAMVVTLALAIVVLAACGSAAAPPTSAPAAGEGEQGAIVDEHMTGTEDSVPAAMMAPTFELSNAAGETISLASYAGEKNVVLVFYRGFW